MIRWLGGVSKSSITRGADRSDSSADSLSLSGKELPSVSSEGLISASTISVSDSGSCSSNTNSAVGSSSKTVPALGCWLPPPSISS